MRARSSRARYWVPLLVGTMCLVATMFVGPILTWVLTIAAFGFVLDGVTVMWERAGGTGNLTTHRQ